jgi:superfamily II DNA helicase RecQ
LIYTNTKADADMFEAHVSAMIGTHARAGFTGGRRRVDKLNGGMAKEDQEAIMAEFSKGAASFIRVLFASIIIGMGTHLESLYHVWRIGQPRTLLEWIQELGRSGRDGGDSEACLFVRRKGANWEPCMKRFCTSNTCLRFQIVWLFNPDISENTIREELEQAGYGFCCSVCDGITETKDSP